MCDAMKKRNKLYTNHDRDFVRMEFVMTLGSIYTTFIHFFKLLKPFFRRIKKHQEVAFVLS